MWLEAMSRIRSQCISFRNSLNTEIVFSFCIRLGRKRKEKIDNKQVRSKFGAFWAACRHRDRGHTKREGTFRSSRDAWSSRGHKLAVRLWRDAIRRGSIVRGGTRGMMDVFVGS